MTVTLLRCLLITCNTCGDPGEDGDAGVPHFETIEQARDYLDDWEISPDAGMVTCEGCVARRVCAEQGHDPGEWVDCRCGGRIAEHRARGCDQFRHCTRCGDLELRPAPASCTARGSTC